MAEENIDVLPPAVIVEQKTAVAVADTVKAMIRTAEDALTIAQTMSIADHDDYQFVIDERNSNLKTVDSLKAEMSKALDPLKLVVDTVRGWFGPGIVNTQAAIKIQNNMIGEWDAKIRREREEAEAKQREQERAARQQAERDAAAARAVGEAQAAEQRSIAAKAEQDRAAALQAGNAQAAEDAARVAATATESAHHAVETANAVATAATINAAAAVNNRTTVMAPMPEVKGNSMRKHFVAELNANTTQEEAKLKIILSIAACHAAAQPMPLLGLLEIDEKALKKLAQSLESNMSVPGYTAVNRPIAAGSKK